MKDFAGKSIIETLAVDKIPYVLNGSKLAEAAGDTCQSWKSWFF